MDKFFIRLLQVPLEFTGCGFCEWGALYRSADSINEKGAAVQIYFDLFSMPFPALSLFVIFSPALARCLPPLFLLYSIFSGRVAR